MNTRGVGTRPKNCVRELKICLVRTPLEDFTNSVKSTKICTEVNKDNKSVLSVTKVPVYKQVKTVATRPKNCLRKLKVCLVRSPFEDFTNSLRNTKICTDVNKDTKSVLPVTKVPVYKQVKTVATRPKNCLRKLKVCLVGSPFEDFTNSLRNTKICTDVNKDTKSVLPVAKVPVYKQQVKTVVRKDKSDLYEFDESDSEKKTRKPRRKFDNSAKFNRTMHELLQKLEKLEKKKSRKPRRKKSVVPISPSKYETNVNSVLKQVMEKVRRRKHSQNKENVDAVLINKKELKVIHEKSSKSNISIPAPKQNILKECAINCTNNLTVPQPEIISNTVTFKLSPRINIMSDVLIKRVELPVPLSHDLYEDDDHDNDHDNSCNDYPSYDIDEDKYFGFNSDEDDIPRKGPTKLDFSNSTNISHLSIDSHMFTPRRPNAHSTMIHNMQNSPWRLSAAVRHNPHFLLIKSNSLPSLKQDMVLNYSQVDKLEQNFSKTPSHVEVTKPIIQSSILDYVDYSDHIENKQENLIKSSLFDYEEFVTKPRHRRVLGVIHNNKQLVSTPIKTKDLRVPPPDVSFIDHNDSSFFELDNSNNEANNNDSPFFGFDNSNNEDKENSNRPSVAKPFRLNVEAAKFYKKKLREENIPTTENNDDKIMDEMVSDMEDIGNENQDPDSEMHLFEDAEPEIDMSIALPKVKYERKRRRRLKSDASENSDDDKPKKRKKDIMTKAEEAEMEKWASEFNAMCQEVDKHELDIE